MKFILSLVLFSAIGLANCPPELVIGWEDYPPFQVKKGSEVTGVDIELASAIFTKMGCKFKFQEIPWARHLQLLEKGDVHVAMSASKTPEREKFAHFPDPYRDSANIMFTTPENKGKVDALKNLKDITSVADFKLAVIRSYAYGGDFTTLKDDNDFRKHLVATKDLDDSFNKIVSGGATATIGDKFVASLKAESFGGKIVPASLTVSSEPAFIMFSKKGIDDAFLANFNSALKSLKDDGTIKNIEAKYIK